VPWRRWRGHTGMRAWHFVHTNNTCIMVNIICLGLGLQETIIAAMGFRSSLQSLLQCSKSGHSACMPTTGIAYACKTRGLILKIQVFGAPPNFPNQKNEKRKTEKNEKNMSFFG